MTSLQAAPMGAAIRSTEVCQGTTGTRIANRETAHTAALGFGSEEISQILAASRAGCDGATHAADLSFGFEPERRQPATASATQW